MTLLRQDYFKIASMNQEIRNNTNLSAIVWRELKAMIIWSLALIKDGTKIRNYQNGNDLFSNIFMRETIILLKHKAIS